MMQTIKYNFTLTGFVIALLLVAMFTGMFGIAIAEFKTTYSVVGNTSTESYYNISKQIVNNTNEIRNASNIGVQQQAGLLDLVAGFFSAGYNAMQTTMQSFNLFSSLMDNASNDLPFNFEYYKTYLVAIVLMALVIGVLIAALIKVKL